MLEIAERRRAFEVEVERDVLGPLRQLADDTCPAVQKSRRSLSKACTDLRTAREKVANLKSIAASQVNVGLIQSAGTSYASSAINTVSGSSSATASSLYSYSASSLLTGAAASIAPASNDPLMRLSQAQTQAEDLEREADATKATLANLSSLVRLFQAIFSY
ncbi:unnamed protein product [Protopolystoma xenopodis]|uniref:Uncharacterized protein n=1 Tax=Protopolystoma xenopodis TaxID=117903 RepID=A0A448WVA2_9PLAT|nr:unnamed protein product [Protopolystoma xenopodis]